MTCEGVTCSSFCLFSQTQVFWPRVALALYSCPYRSLHLKVIHAFSALSPMTSSSRNLTRRSISQKAETRQAECDCESVYSWELKSAADAIIFDYGVNGEKFKGGSKPFLPLGVCICSNCFWKPDGWTSTIRPSNNLLRLFGSTPSFCIKVTWVFSFSSDSYLFGQINLTSGSLCIFMTVCLAFFPAPLGGLRGLQIIGRPCSC